MLDYPALNFMLFGPKEFETKTVLIELRYHSKISCHAAIFVGVTSRRQCMCFSFRIKCRKFLGCTVEQARTVASANSKQLRMSFGCLLEELAELNVQSYFKSTKC